MRTTFGLLLKEEIHAGAMISRPGKLGRMRKNDRLTIVRMFLDELAAMPRLNIINVIIDKANRVPPYDPFEQGWKTLIQRFENTLKYNNFPGATRGDYGLIVADETNETALRRLSRRMTVYNPVSHIVARYGPGYRQLPIGQIVEDPTMRRSHESYFVQAADVAAFALYQQAAPSTYIRKKGARNYFNRLNPVLCRVAATRDPQGVVRL